MPVANTMADTTLHHQTPTVTLTGSNGQVVRSLDFLRRPGDTGPARPLVRRLCLDPCSRTFRTYGARPLAQGAPDALTLSGLSDQPLLSHTADGGTSHTLSDISGRPAWARSAEGTVTAWQYESPDLPGRLLSVTEQAADTAQPRVCQVYIWGEHDAAPRNLAGAPVQIWDNAGVTVTQALSLSGVPLEVSRRLLADPEGTADWRGDEAQCQARLEPVSRALVTRAQADATGTVVSATSAHGVTTHSRYDISGALAGIRLSWQEQGQSREQVVLAQVAYGADGQVVSRTAGNGVVSCYTYDLQSRQLTRVTIKRPPGHPQGAQMLQDLHYGYDPVGNVLHQRDAAVAVEWHNNQQVDGERTYTYDTLSRLTAASGRERLPDTTAGPLAGLQYDLSSGRGVWRRYSEQYDYDDGDNLIRVRHQGVAPWTREMTVLADSNRAVLKTAGPPSLSPDTLFTPGGCQRTLADGRVLSWHADGQMAGVSPVVRAAGGDDREHYQYSRVGERVRKVSSVRVSGGEQRTVVTYAGGMERRQRSTAGGACTLDVVITESGGMRLVEDCVSGSRYIRYALGDRQGSVMGESDEQGCVTAREEYYPYGGSAGGDEEASEVTDRSRRYSGKERDATGLYYYGQRYYQPGLCRWLSADPGGVIDGVNLYRMVRNNPVTLWDSDGLAPTDKIVEKDVGKVYAKYKINAMISYHAQGRGSEVKEFIKAFLNKSPSEGVTNEELPAHAENVATQIIRHVAQESVMRDHASIIALTAKEKEYVQRFYSTNAGASYINTRARDLFRTRPMAAESYTVDDAIGKAAREVGTNGTPLLPKFVREHVKSAFGKGEPLAVMRGALVDEDPFYAQSQYRGTRIPKETLKLYTPGTVIKNVFFASFSYDHVNVQGKVLSSGKKTAGDFYGKYASSSHSGENVLYELPPRSGVKTIKISSANELETVVAPGQLFKIEEKTNEGNYWHIKLRGANGGSPLRMFN